VNDLATSLTTRYFNASGGELHVGAIPVSALVQKYHTPMFVYDTAVMNTKLAGLRRALPSGFSIYYSVKANPNPAIISHFLSLGCGLEIASAGEFSLALEAGAAPSRLLFAGPGKTEAELELVLSQGISEVHVESLTETERISRICRRSGVIANIAIRVNPAAEVEGGAMRMGGRPAPFGVDEEILDQVLDRVLGDPALNFCGIHLFTGTQILDPDILLAQYRHGLELARSIVRRIGRPLQTLDFGGGLGIPYFAHEKELDLDRLQNLLGELFAAIAHDPEFKGTSFVVEPGRYLVGEAGVYLARVNDIKISRGRKFLILDGGMNHHLAASGNLGQTIKRNFPVALANKLSQPAEETVDVVGPLCTPLDTLARNVTLPVAEIGDLFCIFQSGAYARSASPAAFLSHSPASEVLVDSGQDFFVGSREAAAEVAKTAALERCNSNGGFPQS
jgi:diaminopimelate decarboxylase